MMELADSTKTHSLWVAAKRKLAYAECRSSRKPKEKWEGARKQSGQVSHGRTSPGRAIITSHNARPFSISGSDANPLSHSAFPYNFDGCLSTGVHARSPIRMGHEVGLNMLRRSSVTCVLACAPFLCSCNFPHDGYRFSHRNARTWLWHIPKRIVGYPDIAHSIRGTTFAPGHLAFLDVRREPG